MRHTRRGLLAMVNNGADAHASQFYVTLGDDALDYLDGQSTIFGAVVDDHHEEGQLSVLDKMNAAIVDDDKVPYVDIRCVLPRMVIDADSERRITHTHVLHDPFDDPPALTVPARSPSPTMEQIKSIRIAVDEDVEEDDGRTDAERQVRRGVVREA